MSRQRRTTEEVRSLMLSAAVELFGEKGYAGATTRDIAARAGVSGTLLFRHFGDKERLFRAAVIEPIDQFLTDYTAGWLNAPLTAGNPDDMIRTFVTGLYDLARANRQLVLAAAADHLATSAQIAFGGLEDMARQTAHIHAYSYDPAVAVRAAVAMVLGIGLFQDELFAGTPPPGRDHVIDEVTATLLRGLTRAD
jgi:AcrR family transcriptional regulator